MRRIALWTTATVVIVVLLFTYRTSLSGPAATATAGGAQAPGVVTAPGPSAGTGAVTPSRTSGSGSGTASGPAKPLASSGSSPAKAVEVNGSVAQTPFGPLLVRITVHGHTITDVTALTYPSGTGRDHEINARALPVLRSETLTAQNARIDTVSGATYTSDGYRRSLQAALDAAHL